MALDFIQRLTHGPILTDGAMGTELLNRGNIGIETCLEQHEDGSFGPILKEQIKPINMVVAGGRIECRHPLVASYIRTGVQKQSHLLQATFP